MTSGANAGSANAPTLRSVELVASLVDVQAKMRRNIMRRTGGQIMAEKLHKKQVDSSRINKSTDVTSTGMTSTGMTSTDMTNSVDSSIDSSLDTSVDSTLLRNLDSLAEKLKHWNNTAVFSPKITLKLAKYGILDVEGCQRWLHGHDLEVCLLTMLRSNIIYMWKLQINSDVVRKDQDSTTY
jgi:hypothetical protein